MFPCVALAKLVVAQETVTYDTFDFTEEIIENVDLLLLHCVIAAIMSDAVFLEVAFPSCSQAFERTKMIL